MSTNNLERPTAQPQSGRISQAFSSLGMRILFAFHLVWIYALRWASTRVAEWDYKTEKKQDPRIGRGTRQVVLPNKKLVVIGDDFGFGVGDWSILASVGSQRKAGPLGLLRCLSWPLPYMSLPWCCFNRCVRHSTSADWAPPQDVELAQGDRDSNLVRSRNRKGNYPGYLFEQMFDPIEGKDARANLVIAVVGSLDMCSPEMTANNIVRMCEALVSRRCVVIIATPIIPGAVRPHVPHPAPKKLPDATRATQRGGEVEEVDEAKQSQKTLTPTAPPPPPPPPVAAHSLAALSEPQQKSNKRIRERIAAVKKAVSDRWPDQGGGPVRLLRDPSEILFHQTHFRFGGRYISPSGYKQWGRLWEEDIAIAAKAAECEYLEALLSEVDATNDKKND